MDKKTPLVAAILLLSSSYPASAKFCVFTHTSLRDNTPKVFEVDEPICGGGNILRFTHKTYRDEDGSQNANIAVTDNWPGFTQADKRCAEAVRGAQIVVNRPGSIILATTVASFPEVWAYKGSCSSFRSAVMSAWEKQKRENGEKASYKGALEDAGAGEDSMSNLVDQLIELATAPPKKSKD